MPTTLPKLAFDPVPPLARAVIELFEEALPDVRFPDMDRHMLETAADDLRAAQVEIEQLEVELAAAKATLSGQAEQLASRAQRALAYARIFAETDASLSARVAQIKDEPSLPKSAPVKRRGRMKRDDAESEHSGLFGMEEGAALEAH